MGYSHIWAIIPCICCTTGKRFDSGTGNKVTLYLWKRSKCHFKLTLDQSRFFPIMPTENGQTYQVKIEPDYFEIKLRCETTPPLASSSSSSSPLDRPQEQDSYFCLQLLSRAGS